MASIVDLIERFWLPLTLLFVAAVATFSLVPQPELLLRGPAFSDKTLHLAAYAALTVPVATARPRGSPWWVAAFLALGAAIEVAQPYANRHGDLIDWLANAAGIALGAAVGAVFRAAWRRARS